MVFDKVKELISEQLDVKADDITEASNIQDDLIPWTLLIW